MIAQDSDQIVRIPKHRDPRWLALLVCKSAQIAEDDHAYWVRLSPNAETDPNRLLSQLPGQQYQLDATGLLTERGKQVATARLPDLSWMNLQDCLHLQFPIPALAANRDSIQPVQLTLQRSACERPTAGGLFELSALLNWLEHAPLARLSSLKYTRIASKTQGLIPGDRSILLLGTPLPTLDCIFLWQHGQILVPNGFSWHPDVSPRTVSAAFQLESGQTLLWLGPTQSAVISPEMLQPLTRSGLRKLSPSA